jgi:hypothetical protein
MHSGAVDRRGLVQRRIEVTLCRCTSSPAIEAAAALAAPAAVVGSAMPLAIVPPRGVRG